MIERIQEKYNLRLKKKAIRSKKAKKRYKLIKERG